MVQTPLRMYDELASWWPLLSPASHYDEEAEDLERRLAAFHTGPASSMLELGSGGGSLASHLKSSYAMTLTDASPAMLAVSQALNPSCEHRVGDMRTMRLDRTFDIVLLHDAVMYMTSRDDLQAALTTAAAHCRPGGTVVVLPDFVRETFRPDTGLGGEDGPDGRAMRYIDWTWDPDPADDTFVVDYAFLLRDADGQTHVEHERHVEGLFARDVWRETLEHAGFDAVSAVDPWSRDVFLGRRRAL